MRFCLWLLLVAVTPSPLAVVLTFPGVGSFLGPLQSDPKSRSRAGLQIYITCPIGLVNNDAEISA